MKPTLAAEERKHFCAQSARSLIQFKFSEVKRENSIVVNFVLKYYLALLIFSTDSPYERYTWVERR